MMKNRPLHQWTLDVAKGIFHSSQQNVGAPDFVSRQILPIRLENITAVEFLGDRFFCRRVLSRRGSYSRSRRRSRNNAPPEDSAPATGRSPAGFCFPLSVGLGDALLKLIEIGDQFRFLRFSNGPVLFFTPFAAAENVNHAVLLLALDFHA